MPACTQCSAQFEITPSDLAFLEKVSPVFAGKKELIPPPTLCPDCRLQRRLSFRNESRLYHRKCDITGRQIVSLYAQERSCVVYEPREWWSDRWSALDFARAYDPNRSFMEQLHDLRNAVPRMALMQEQNENSDYTSNVSKLKNCYLLFSSDFNRDCCYGVWMERCQDCFDGFLLDECELSYECFFSQKLYACSYAYYSSACRDSAFLLDCHGCSDCLLCWGLRQKQYCIANVQYSREEYVAKRASFALSSYRNFSACVRQFREMVSTAIHPPIRKRGSVADSTGDCIANVQHCRECYEVMEARDCTRTFSAFKINDISDSDHIMGELAYECSECFPTPCYAAFNLNCYTGSNLYYCDLCMNNCQHCFGCVGLKHSSYCILNKQYTKEEYERLVPKIISAMRSVGEFGEFLPAKYSPFGYNESEAQAHFPLQRDAVAERGWNWAEDEDSTVQYLGPAVEIPDNIADVEERLTTNILLCEVSRKPYKVIPQELAFYRSRGLPIPRRCPQQRLLDRHMYRTPRKLWKRTCAKCGKAIETTYAPNRPEIVYCEACYLSSVY